MTSSTVWPPPTCFPTLYCCLAAIDELGLHATPRCSRNDRLLDELGQRLAVAQDGFRLRPEPLADADGERWRSASLNV